jgi:dienelactone hydrolase
MKKTIIFGLLAFAIACGEDASVAPPGGGSDSGTPDGGGVVGNDGGASGSDASAGPWISVEPISDDGTVVAEKVSYRSQGLRIYALHCRPKAAGKYKAYIFNHGGVGGLGGFTATQCAQAVKNGYVVLMSSYRGEDGSDGNIEVCLGEVDDVLALIDIAKALPYVDPQKIVMEGASHGGCITTRAVQRGAPVKAAADVFGPKDWAADYAYWKKQVGDGSPDSASLNALIQVCETAMGGTPDTKPDEYKKRSPLEYIAELDAFPGAYMAVHGGKDVLVTVKDTCRTAAVVKGMKSYHLDGALAVATSEPPGCEGTNVTWLAGPKPSPAWPEARYALVYDEAGHEIASASGQAMFADTLFYLVAKAP